MKQETSLFQREGKSVNANRRRRLKLRLFRRDGGKCFWCERPITLDNMKWPLPLNLATIDHIETKSSGGSGSSKNMVLTCYPCNQDRGDMRAEEFLTICMQRNIHKGED